MLPVTIIRQSHQSQLGADGLVQRIVRIDFKVGSNGPFNLSIPEDSYTAAEAQRQIEALAGQVSDLQSKFSAPPGK